MKTTESQNEQTQIDEGPCDLATKEDILKMTAKRYVDYTNWKKECEEMEKRNSTSDDEAKLDKMIGEWGNSILDQEIAKQKAEDDADEKDDDKDDVWTTNFKNAAAKRIEQQKRRVGKRDSRQADEFESVQAEDESETPKIGRPRGGAHIENERFWDLPDDQLHYIIKDASAAVQENPTARKATQGPGNWSDQINDAATVLTYRQNKRLDKDIKPQEDNVDESVVDDDNVSGALDSMRQHFHDYNHDPSDRWEKYKQYRDHRKQISHRAKNVVDEKDNKPSKNHPWKKDNDRDFVRKKDIAAAGGYKKLKPKYGGAPRHSTGPIGGDKVKIPDRSAAHKK